MSGRLHAVALTLALALIFCSAHGASAASSSSPSLPGLPLSLGSGSKSDDKAKPPEDPAKVPDFVSRLDDRQARALLLDTLAAKPQQPAARERDTVTDMFSAILAAGRAYSERIIRVSSGVPDLAEARDRVLTHLDATPGSLAGLVGWILLSLGAAAALETGVRLLLDRTWRRRRQRQGLPPPPSTLRNGGRLGQRCVGLACFTAVAAGFVLASPRDLSQAQQDFALSFVAAALLVRLADTAAYLCIAHLPPLSSAAARPLVRQGLRASVVAAHTTVIIGALILTELRNAAVPLEGRLLVGLGLWAVLGCVLFVLLNRLRLVIRPPDENGPFKRETILFRWIRTHWYGIARAVIAAVWIFTILGALESGPMAFEAGVASLMIAAYTPAAVRVLTLLLRRSFARTKGHEDKVDPPWVTSVLRCARILATVAGLYTLGRIWGLDVFAYASTRLGESVARMVLDVAMIVLLAYVVWEIIRAIIRSEAGGEPADPDDDEDAAEVAFEEGSMKPQTRMQTFMPLVEKFLFVVVLIVAGMMILKTLGVDTAPLLAGAGIVGIAIGFGAQTLVKDIVSGIFFLLDDAFRLGEYVEIDQTRGTVEGISIRSLRIRHHRGAVHTVPFGTIQRLTNYSRDWIILKLEFLLSFDTDLGKVKKIVKQIGKELLEDEEYGQHFLEPVKSQGVRRMEQIGMVIGIKFMAKPGEQFILRREVYQRVRDSFEKNGISFARPQVVVQVPNGRMTAEESEAIAAAAAEAADMPPTPEELAAQKKKAS